MSSRKRYRSGGVCISLHEIITSTGLQFPGLDQGIEAAQAILLSDDYATSFLANIDQDDASALSTESVKEYLMSMTFDIRIIRIGAHLDALALVYRKEFPQTIFLNPLMLLQMKIEEAADPNTSTAHAFFLGCKLVHETSHLIHPHLSRKLALSVVKKTEGGEGKKKMETAEKTKGGNTFTDLGEMIEFDMYGGTMELVYNPEVAFDARYIVSYHRPSAKSGHHVVVPTGKVTSENVSILRVAKGEEIDKPYRGQRGHLELSSGTRFSAPGLFGESDVIEEGKEEDVDAEGFMLPEATF